jgi:chaperonin cofactor prefoldin
LGEARRELKESNERLEETIARRKVIEEQRRKKREEVARLRSGMVLPDHGEDEGDELEDLLVWKPDLWRR